jgi:hypothetical protein
MDFFIKALLYIVINGFGILATVTFFWFKIGKKNNEYQKVLKTFNISPKRNLLEELSVKNYILPIAFFTLVSLVVSSLFFASSELFDYLLYPELLESLKNEKETPFGNNFFFVGPYFGEGDNASIQINSIAVVTWAFVGSYLWSSSVIVRRLAQGDLTPVVFYKSGLRILFACSVALAFSFLMGGIDMFAGQGGSDLRANIPAVGLVAGMVPERFMNYLMKRIKAIFSGGSDMNNEQLSLKKIEGLGQSQRERLWEEGIDNAEN